MPNPEPTLAEICKTVREMEAELDAAHAEMEDWVAGRIRTVNANRVYHAARALSEWIAPHALALVQAAEQGEEYRNKMDEIHARETARIGPHGGIDSTDCARAGGMLNAVEEIRQALSSGAPT